MNKTYAEYLKTHATPVELCAILGPNWAVCRKTRRNLERYQNCITPKEYSEANRLAIARRGAGATEVGL